MYSIGNWKQEYMFYFYKPSKMVLKFFPWKTKKNEKKTENPLWGGFFLGGFFWGVGFFTANPDWNGLMFNWINSITMGHGQKLLSIKLCRFKGRMREYSQYCQHVASIQHFKVNATGVYEFLIGWEKNMMIHKEKNTNLKGKKWQYGEKEKNVTVLWWKISF